MRIAPEPQPRRRVKWLLPIAALALSAVAAYGCGSTGDEAPATRAAPPSTATGPADASVPPGAEGHSGRLAEGSKEGVAAKGTATNSPRGKQDGKGSGGSHGGAGSPPETAGRAPSGGGRIASSNSGRCPSGVSRSECELIAEQVSDTQSFSVSSVEDCVKAIGEEECERLLEAESASKGGDPPIDVNECLKAPTPRCEAALRPILEAEQAASNAKK